MDTTQTASWWLVINGKAAADGALRDAIRGVRAAGQPVQVRVTYEAGDVDRIVREALDAGASRVVAAGGDGTLSAVATALVRTGNPVETLPTMGLVPLGTANDFAMAVGIAPDCVQALALVRDGEAQAIDLLRVVADGEEHWAVNMASGGFGTDVTTETNEGLKKMLGGLAYVITGLGKLGQIQPVQARIRGDMEWEGGFIALGIGNGRQAGGGQALCPDALINDGFAELTIVPPLEGQVLDTLGTALADGRDAALDKVALRQRVRAMSLEALGNEPLTLNLDGEPVAARRFEIECLPARLRMHLPAECTLLSSCHPA